MIRMHRSSVTDSVCVVFQTAILLLRIDDIVSGLKKKKDGAGGSSSAAASKTEEETGPSEAND